VAADETTFEGWALLELMGHRKLAGFVREVSIAGAGFIRIDVPGVQGGVIETTLATQFYAPGAVYAVTPITEDLARRFALRCQPEPVTRWELPPAVGDESPDPRPEDLEDEP
jgi:hypothetical protein